MATNRRLKRKVLRQAVEENLDLLNGARRVRRRRHRALRRLALLVVPLVLLGASTYVLSRALAAPEDFVIVTQPARSGPLPPVPGEAAAVAPAPPAEARALPAPEPIEPSVLRLGVRRIVLDPGHGGVNVGTVAPGGVQEKDLTLDISHRIRNLLDTQGFEVLMTRDEDVHVGLKERTEYANRERADLFVSIHVNWIEAEQIRGVETYYLGASDDPYITAIAAAENTGSSYSLADFRQLVEGLYAGVRQKESRRLAGAIQQQLLGSLRRINPQLRDRGVKTAPFVVLVTSEMPAVLVEVSCLSNAQEAQLLQKPYYRQYIAEAVADGIGRYAETLAPRPPEETAPETDAPRLAATSANGTERTIEDSR
jgi:N-acetylmuramoyl-L-alanine amidase